MCELFIDTVLKSVQLFSLLQWDLVCSNQWKVPFASSTLFMGYLFGSLISGQFSDRYFINVYSA